jgi:hypothetical protein
LLAALAAGPLAACSFVGANTPLFPGKATVQRFDFEHDTLHQAPDGFDARLGQWSVAESPTATSGTQVLVNGGDSPAVLVVKDAAGVTGAAGEVEVRVFLGSSGAGLSCSGSGNGPGHLLKIEPNAARMALYRKTDDSMKVVDETPAPIPKGEWARLGIRCEADRVVGYLDGKPLVRDRSVVGAIDLALYADAGVTAQFDDLTYWVKK